jgi:hypothetical protein
MAGTSSLGNAAVTAGAASAILASTELPVDEGNYDILVAAHFVPAASQGAAGTTSFATLQVRDYSANHTTPTVIASLALTAALTADVAKDLVLVTATYTITGPAGETVTLAGNSVNQGDTLDLYNLQTAGGGAIPAGKVELEFQ